MPIKTAYLRYAVCGRCLCIKNANCYNFGVQKRLRAFLNPIFTGRGHDGKRQLPRLFPRGNSHAAGALRHGSQHDPLSHRCAMPDFPLSSLRASSPRSGWKSFLKGRAKSTAGNFLIAPNTLVLNFTAWLPLWGSWRGSA